MTYTVQLDFKAGLDRRRPQSAAPAGSLWECINAHITRGGDIEKRKAFVAKYALPAGETFGLARASDSLYVFGSAAAPAVPAGVTYQRLQHPDGLSMTALLDWDTFSGKIYAIAEYSDGSVHHFYDGNIVADWDNGIVRSAMTNNDGIAAHLESLIDDDPTYATSVSSNVITIQAANAGAPFTISAETENGGNVNDQSITLVETQANVTGGTEVLSSSSFEIIAGTASAGVNKISSVMVDGVEILNTAVDWATSHSATATAVAAQINSYSSSPEYTASASGPVVTIRGATGSGATPNGKAVSVTAAGDVQTTTPAAMAGGVAGTSNVAQTYTATIGGTFEIGDRFTIIIDDKKFGAKFNPTIKGRSCLTHRGKMYATADSLLQFGGVNTATGWNSDDDVGASFINMSNQYGGSEDLVTSAPFQKNLAVFSEQTIQVWAMNADPELNEQLQILTRTGTRARHSVISYGDQDVAYLDRTGIRSLRSREISNLVSVGDIGTPIDPYVQEYLATLTQDEQDAACSVMDPLDGRLWIAVGQRIFVYTSFNTAKINAWTTYEPGFTPEWMVEVNRRICLRSGDTIYLYGGDSGDEYDDSPVTVTMPFFHDNKLANYKALRGFDADLENLWAVTVLVDPRDTSRYTDVGNIEGFTYLDGNIGIPVRTTHAAPKFVCASEGYARISNFCLHFQRAGVEAQ